MAIRRIHIAAFAFSAFGLCGCAPTDKDGFTSTLASSAPDGERWEQRRPNRQRASNTNHGVRPVLYVGVHDEAMGTMYAAVSCEARTDWTAKVAELERRRSSVSTTKPPQGTSIRVSGILRSPRVNPYFTQERVVRTNGSRVSTHEQRIVGYTLDASLPNECSIEVVAERRTVVSQGDAEPDISELSSDFLLVLDSLEVTPVKDEPMRPGRNGGGDRYSPLLDPANPLNPLSPLNPYSPGNAGDMFFP